MSTRLVADVGGTNTRMALFDSNSNQFRQLKTYINRDYNQFEQVIDTWLNASSEEKPEQCCIAVAAAPSNDLVRMHNMDWSFSASKIAEQFNFAKFKWINDFTAIAHALPHLGSEDCYTVHAGGEQQSNQKLAAVGPGTGLGGATVELIEGKPHASAAEPGHNGLSPGTKLELELFAALLDHYPDIYAELLISGPGLLRLYKTLCGLNAREYAARTPSEISSRALESMEEDSVLALQTFCALLGSVCGDFVLSNGAFGGLYLAGGIIPGMIEFLVKSDFHSRFCQKGGMQSHLAEVPIYVITARQPGLIGAAHVPI
ncbi:MAG: glucokinase [Halioglobus sp.]